MSVDERMKKVFSMLLCLCMVLQYVPTTAVAVGAAEGGLCEHHTAHTAGCGYVEAAPGSDCTHAHDELCGYIEAVEGVSCACEAAEDGTLTHTESCGYVAPVAGADCIHVHDDVCGYVAAVEARDCHYECAECATAPASEEPSEESSEPAPVCDCGTDDALIHAVSCAVYVAPEDPQCFCAEKCTEVNEWCDICGFDYTQCGGTDMAATWDGVDLSSNTASFGNDRGTWYLNPDNAATEFYNLIDDRLMLGAYGYVPERTYITTNAYDYRDDLGNDGFLWTDCKNQTIRDGRYYIYVFSRNANQINRIEYIVDVQVRYTVNISVTGAPSGYGGVTLNGSNAGSPQYLQKGGNMTLTVKDVQSHKHTVTFDAGVTCAQNGDTYAFSNINKSFTFKVVYEADEFATVSFGQPEGATISVNGNSTSPVQVIAGMPYTVSVKTNDGYYLTGITVDGTTTSLDTMSYNKNLTAGANGSGHTISATTAKVAIPVNTTASITYTKNQDNASLVKAIKDAVYAGSDSNVKNSATVNYLYFGDFYSTILDSTDIWQSVFSSGEMLSCNVKESISVKLKVGDVYSQSCTLYLYDGDISANGEIKKDYTEEPVKLAASDFNCACPANFSSSYPAEYRYYTESGQRLSSAPTEVGKYQVQVKASSYHTNPGAFLGTSWTSWSGLIPFEIVSVPAYSITAENSSGGRVTASKATSIAGKTVTLTVEPNVGYLVDTVSYNGTPITPVEGVYSFTMPAGAVTISATFVACTHGTYENGICTLCGEPCPGHTGGEATCTEKAVCGTCGASYGEVSGHTPNESGYTDVTADTHTFTCDACDESVTEDHNYDETTRLCACGAMHPDAVATVSMNGEVLSAHYSLDAAITDVYYATAEDKAVVTLLKDCEYAGINGGVFTLNLGGNSLRTEDDESPALCVGGGTVTVTGCTVSGTRSAVIVNGGTLNITEGATITTTETHDSTNTVDVRGGTLNISGGTITGPVKGVYVQDGTVNITGGTIETEGNMKSGSVYLKGGTANISGGTFSDKYALNMEGGTVYVTGGTFQSGNRYALRVVGGTACVTGGTFTSNGYADISCSNGTVILGVNEETGVGAIFPDNLTVSSTTLNAILADGVSYWQGDKQLTVADDAEDILDGTVTVKKACDHSGSQHTTATDNHDGAHIYDCTVCGTSVVEEHSFENEAHKCVCGKVETFTVTVWDENENIVVSLTNATATYGQDFTAELTSDAEKEPHYKIWYYDVGEDRYADFTYENGNLTIPAANITGDIEVRVYPYVTVTFHGNGGIFSDPASGTQYDPLVRQKDYGKTGYLLQESSEYREGHAFAGLNTKPDGTGTSYRAGGEYTYLEDLELYAQWEVNTYTYQVETYTMDAYGNYGEPVTEERSAAYGTSVNAAPTSLAEGFYLDEAHEDSLLTATVPANDDLVLKVYIGRSQYPITWDLNGDEAYDDNLPQNKYYGISSLSIWDTFKKEGHSFTCLEDPASGKQYVNARPDADHYYFEDVDMPVGGLTLKAIWTVNAYALHVQDQTLDVDYGTSLADALADIAPEKTGHTFTGWTYHYLDENDVEQPYTGAAMPAVELYAEPVFEPIQYNITWDMAGCSYEVSNYSELPAKLPYNVDGDAHNVNFTDITAPEGYEFAGFEDGNGNALSYDITDQYRLNLTVSGDMTVKAVIEPKTYKATWVSFDGSPLSINVKYGETITVCDHAPVPGYTFVGWEGYTEGMTMPAKNVTFTAIYQVNQYTITFNTDGGSEVASITQDYGTAVTAPAAPSRDGYHFVEWQDLPATMPAENVTVKAVWEAHKDPTYSASGNTITAKCGVCGEMVGTASITAESKTYDGTPAVVDYHCSGSVDPNEVGPSFTKDGRYVNGEDLAEAGTYTASITLGLGEEAATASVDFTIAKKELTATVSGSMSKSYDGTNAVPERHSLKIVLDGVISGDTVTASADFVFADVNAGTKTINATNIALSGKDAANYELKATTASADVGEIVVLDLQYLEPHNYEIVFGEEPVYNGKKQTMTVERFVMCGLDVTYELTGNTGTEAGFYTMTVTATGNFAGTVTQGWQISKKAVTVTAEDQTITYGSTISDTEFTADGLVDGHSVTVTLTPSTANVTANGTITASAVVITADGTDVTDNYNVSYTSGKLVNEPDTSRIDTLSTENVTSANEEDIKAVQAMMASAETDGIDDTTAEQWAAITAKCEDLTRKIEAVEAENARIADVAADYDLNTVKSSDEAAIIALIADIDEQLATNNLTDEERSELEGLKTKCNNLIAKIDGTGTLIGQLDKTVDDLDAETVKSTDKAALERVIADAQTLIDSGNVTEAEKEALVKTQEDAKALIKVINDTATENKELTDQAATFDEDTVNSTDKTVLEQLAKDIEDLLDTDNLTEDEREALETVLDQVEGMIDTIEDTAEDSKAATDAIDELDSATVTSDDKDELERAIEIIDKLLQDDHLTEDERKALEDAKADAEALIERIEAAQDATDTENTEKVEDVTADNVKPEDKEALEDAKADLEKAMEDNAGNYTEDEKQAIQDEIQRIEDAIEALENVQDVTETITQLPEAVEPDDEETAEKILDTKMAYDELTDHEKSLVDETTKEKLDGLVDALTAYDIIKGDGGKWTKGNSYGLSFTVNGSFSKFVGIEVDGKEVASSDYTAESGSTIINLKQSFLKRLSTGEHTITVLYTDGETSGTFKILAASSTPATGDNSNLMLHGSMFTISLAVIVVLLLASKKCKQKNA